MMTGTMQRVAMTAGFAIVVACQGCQGPQTAEAPDAPGADGTAMPENPRKALNDMKEARFREAIAGLEFNANAVIVTDPIAGRTPDDAMADVAEGAEKLAVNRRTGALTAYVRAARTDPGLADAYTGLGRALTAKGKTTYALAAYLTAGRLDPALAEAPFGAAMSLARLGRFDEAIEQMRQAVELDPANADAHERLAIWYYYLDDTDASWQHVQAARGLGQEPPGQFIALLESKAPQRSSIVN
jgi:tetratricopeptide (TPR) repeat protein